MSRRTSTGWLVASKGELARPLPEVRYPGAPNALKPLLEPRIAGRRALLSKLQHVFERMMLRVHLAQDATDEVCAFRIEPSDRPAHPIVIPLKQPVDVRGIPIARAQPVSIALRSLPARAFQAASPTWAPPARTPMRSTRA